jgi:hypothetical protein
MGGDAAAASSLETFMSSLNATRDAPYEWSGNEPDEWAPWEFDYFGAPVKTQQSVRAIVNTEYADAPVDEPGNDDLGAIASWYVWAALGLFPVIPGSANLALASPLFPSVTITLPDGHRLVEDAPGAAASRPYVHGLTVSGVTQPASQSSASGCSASSKPHSLAGTWDLPWLPASVIQTGGSLHFTLSSSPDPGWASSPADSPPSFGSGELPAVGFSSPSGATSLVAGQPASVELGAASAGGDASTVHWQVASVPSGLQVSPSSGTLAFAAANVSAGSATNCGRPSSATQALTVTAAAAGTYSVRINLTTASGTQLPPVVLDVAAQP